MNKKLHQACFALLILVVSGCAGPYRAPESGPTAQLRVAIITDNIRYVRRFAELKLPSASNRSMRIPLAMLPQNRSTEINRIRGLDLGIPLSATLRSTSDIAVASAEIVIPAGVNLQITTTSAWFGNAPNSITTCKIESQIIATTGEILEIRYIGQAEGLPGICRATIQRIVQNSNGEWTYRPYQPDTSSEVSTR